MKTVFYVTESYTAAIKAEKTLKSNGIKAYSGKVSGRNGCSYGVRVYSEYEKAEIIIHRSGIRIVNVIQR